MALGGQISAQELWIQDNAKDASQPGMRCVTALHHTRHLSPVLVPHASA